MNDKRYADIAGQMWQVAYPFCAGCDEFMVGGACNHEGNGCKYPDKRIARPRTFQTALYTYVEMKGDNLEKIQEDIRKSEIEKETP